MLIFIVIGVVALSVLIITHELGHLITAKAVRVRVEEFGLGFPPRLLSFKRGETRYSLNAIPFGGFTKMAGEEDPNVPGSLASKGIPARLLVLSAGSLMNALLPLLLFSVALMLPHDVVIGKVVVEEVVPESPAAMAGIEVGDVIFSVNNKPVGNTSDLHRYIHVNRGKEITLLVGPGESTTKEVQLIPRWKPPPGQGAIGVRINMLDRTVVRQHYPLWKAVPLGITKFIEAFVLYKNDLITMIIGVAPGTVLGPVGIIQITGEAAIKAGFNQFLGFAASISLILAVVNMFPIPALDGGRIAFVLLEWVRRGKRVSPRIEGLVHGIGFALLIALLLIVTYRDVLRIVSGENLLP